MVRRRGDAPLMGAVLRSVQAASVVAGAVVLGCAAYRHRQVVRLAPDLRTPCAYIQMRVSSRTLEKIRARALETAVVDGVVCTERAAGAVRVVLYRPEAQAPTAALVWAHGGGRVAGSPENDHLFCSYLAREAGVLVVSVDYRLAPEHPFPAALDDVMTALRWVGAEAGALGIDPGRVAVGGASAGGGLAAEAAQRARDEDVPVAFQLLEYPMLDDRTAQADSEGRGRLSWSPRANRFGWQSYLGSAAGSPPRYGAAARCEDLAGLPPAWIGVGDLDLFFVEDVTYARRLEKAGVPTTLHVVPRMQHAADGLVPQPPSMAVFWAAMASALRKALVSSGGPTLTGQVAPSDR